MTLRHSPSTHLKYRCASPHAVWWPALCDIIRVRCRRCSGCLAVRETHWVMAAAREQVRAHKTWFITLTFRPADRLQVHSDASALRQISPTATQAQRLARAAGYAVTRYLKRLRKAGFAFRYLIVAEPHRDGFPHFHGVIFDQRQSEGFGEALATQWDAGFTKVAAVKDARALRYVCKYLSKENYSRVRASKKFGDDPNAPPEHVWDPTTYKSVAK